MKHLFTILLFIGVLDVCHAQKTEEDAVKAVVQQLFDGMRKGDSTLVRNAFASNVQMQTAFYNKAGASTLRTENSIDGFVKAVGTPHAEVWDERLTAWDIKIDGNLANVWTPYEFWLGDKQSHCGIDLFVLFKSDKGWQIIYLADTRRKCK
jgi:Putative lumazine-binding